MKGMNNMIPVAEIFGPTIQGEGPNTGLKSIFVRVVGCDFKCDWCDSKFAWQQDNNTKHFTETDLASELVNKCITTNTNHVILTGGNPCLYNFDKVIDILHKNDIFVDVETQGSILPKWLYKVNQLVISPKAPSSNQIDVYENIKVFLTNEILIPINYKVSIKIPVFNNEDIEFAKKYQELVKLIKYEFNSIDIRLYINVGNTDTEEFGDISKRVLSDYRNLVDKIMVDTTFKDVYIMPQIHTLIWGNKQGV